MIDGNEAHRQAELFKRLSENYGAFSAKHALSISPAIEAAIANGDRELVVANVPKSQVENFLACLTELHFKAKPAPFDPPGIYNAFGGGDPMREVVISW